MEQIQKWFFVAIEIFLSAVTILHLRAEYRKHKRSIHRSKAYHPTFWVMVLTLLLVSGLLLLLTMNSNPRVLDLLWNNRQIIWKGILCTLEVSLLAIFFGSLTGTILALVITLPKRRIFLSLIDSTLLSFIYILLGIPVLILLFYFYYGPTKHFPVFWISVIALSINLAPFVAKIVIASIRNISQDQIDAAVSFGYTRWQRFLYFQVLFVLKNSGQSLLVEYYTTIKLSSLASFITLYETYHATMDIVTETNDTVNAYIILAICYVIIVTWIAVLADYLEYRWKPIIN